MRQASDGTRQASTSRPGKLGHAETTLNGYRWRGSGVGLGDDDRGRGVHLPDFPVGVGTIASRGAAHFNGLVAPYLSGQRTPVGGGERMQADTPTR